MKRQVLELGQALEKERSEREGLSKSVDVLSQENEELQATKSELEDERANKMQEFGQLKVTLEKEKTTTLESREETAKYLAEVERLNKEVKLDAHPPSPPPDSTFFFSLFLQIKLGDAKESQETDRNKRQELEGKYLQERRTLESEVCSSLSFFFSSKKAFVSAESDDLDDLDNSLRLRKRRLLTCKEMPVRQQRLVSKASKLQQTRSTRLRKILLGNRSSTRKN